MKEVAYKLADNIKRENKSKARKEERKQEEVMKEVTKVNRELELIVEFLFFQVEAGKSIPQFRLSPEQEELLRKSKTFEDAIDGFKFKRYREHIDEEYCDYQEFLKNYHGVQMQPVYHHDGMGMESWVVMELKLAKE